MPLGRLDLSADGVAPLRVGGRKISPTGMMTGRTECTSEVRRTASDHSYRTDRRTGVAEHRHQQVIDAAKIVGVAGDKFGVVRGRGGGDHQIECSGLRSAAVGAVLVRDFNGFAFRVITESTAVLAGGARTRADSPIDGRLVICSWRTTCAPARKRSKVVSYRKEASNRKAL